MKKNSLRQQRNPDEVVIRSEFQPRRINGAAIGLTARVAQALWNPEDEYSRKQGFQFSLAMAEE